MSARGIGILSLVVALVAGGLGFAAAWRLLGRGEQATTDVEATPTQVVVEATPPVPEFVEFDVLSTVLVHKLMATQDAEHSGPAVRQAFEAISAAWDRHEERLQEAADPEAYAVAWLQRAADSWQNADRQALIQLGLDALERDLGALRPPPRKMRRVHLGTRGGPDAFRCTSCHWKPVPGGGGGLADNTFFDGDGVHTTSALVRSPPSLAGSALLQLLAAEMTSELRTQVEALEKKAAADSQSVSATLRAKGVSFGLIRVDPNGYRDLSGIQGIDEDLVVKPLGWKGTMTTLSQAIEEGLQLQLGLGTDDVGEGTLAALETYIATLAIPVSMPPHVVDHQVHWEQGEMAFTQMGCADCHRPYLILNDPVYDVRADGRLKIDLAKALGLEWDAKVKGWRVWLYSDLKRHAMGEELADHHSVGEIGLDVFRTPALWGVETTSPYLHDGRATTSFDVVIGLHRGEAAQAREAFTNAPLRQKGQIRTFLRTLTLRPRMRVAGK